jgi:hypothetical protein
MKALAHVLVVLAMIVAVPGPVLGADFCVVLKAAVADAPHNFESLRGARLTLAWTDGGGDDETRYAAKAVLPGAFACSVTRDHDDGEDVLTSYVCWFPGSPSKALMITGIGRQITGCLGGQPADTRPGAPGGGDAAAFDLSRPGYVIDVSAAGASAVVLQMSAK